MNLFTVDFQSRLLHKQTSVNVLCPQDAGSTAQLPVLLLLHGMTDDHTGWMRHSLAENYAQRHGICLVIPNADLSFYTDMVYGGEYLTFLAEELPEFLGDYFPMAKSKQNNFVAGNSMGGYGAFLLAMRYPQLFEAAFCLSGPMKISWIYRILSDERLAGLYALGETEGLAGAVSQIVSEEEIPEILINSLLESGDLTRIFKGMFGDGGKLLDGSGVDLFALVKEQAFLSGAVDLYAYCGEQDYHYESNLLFSKTVRSMKIKYQLQTGKGGHEWDYWNGRLPEVFETIGNYLA